MIGSAIRIDVAEPPAEFQGCGTLLRFRVPFLAAITSHTSEQFRQALVFLVSLAFLLLVSTFERAADVDGPLGYRLLAPHSREDVPLDGADNFRVLFASAIFSFVPGGLPAMVAVQFLEAHVFRSIAERVLVYFLHGLKERSGLF